MNTRITHRPVCRVPWTATRCLRASWSLRGHPATGRFVSTARTPMSNPGECPHCKALLPASLPSAPTRKRIARLQAERPDLAAKVAAGDLSVSGACVEAGWVPRRTPFDDAVKLSLRMSDDDLMAFAEWLTSEDFRQARAGKKG